MAADDLVVHDLGDAHYVLEIHERFTNGVGLELHVAYTPRFRWLAWWQRDDGTWLGMAKVQAA